MNSITFMESKEITSCSQLKEIFRDHCGVMIDGRIYTSIESIIDIGYTLALLKDSNNAIFVDEDLDTPEFTRIHSMAYAIHFPNHKS